MAGRGKAYQAATILDKGCDPVHEDEVAQMVGAELRLKSVFGFAEWSCHYARIRDHYIERFAFRDEFIRGGTDALQAGKIQLDQLKATTADLGSFRDLPGCSLRLLKVASGAYDIRSMRREGAGRLHAETSGDPGHKNSFALQVDTGKNLIGGCCISKLCCHVASSA
jgi:hypothetical protein